MVGKKLQSYREMAQSALGQALDVATKGVSVAYQMVHTVINERRGGRSAGQGEAQAEQCPFSGGAAKAASSAPAPDFAAAAAAGVCPFTGQRADGSIPEPAVKAEETPTASANEEAAPQAEAPKSEPVAAARPAKESKPATPRKASAKPSVTPAPAARLGSEADNLEAMSRDELYKLATELDIKGRKDKKKEWLIPAIRQALQQG